MKDNDLVQPIEKLGLKDAVGLIQNFLAHRIVIVPFARSAEPHHRLFLQQFGPDIGSHNDDRIAEIDFAP